MTDPKPYFFTLSFNDCQNGGLVVFGCGVKNKSASTQNLVKYTLDTHITVGHNCYHVSVAPKE